MERFLGGLLAVLALLLCTASTAHAAKIPPTLECAVTFKKAFNRYLGETPEGTTDEKEAAQLMKFSDRLAADRCISDAEALYVPKEGKPFTAECLGATAKTKAFLDPRSAKLEIRTRKFENQVKKPLLKRLGKLDARASRLDRQDRPGKAADLSRKADRLVHSYFARKRAFNGSVVAGDQAYKSLLVVYELASLRCFGPELKLGTNARGPAEKLLRRNRKLIYKALYFAVDHAFKFTIETSGSSVTRPARRAFP